MTTTNTTSTIDTAAELANVGAWRAMERELTLVIDNATQWATIYRGDRPIGTAERRRVLDKNAPDWTIYTTDGRKLFTLWAAGNEPATRIKRRMAAHLVEQEPAPATIERDDQAAPYDVHRQRLQLEGYRLGSDLDGFDVYRGADGARAWIDYQDGGHDGLFTVRRGALAGSKADVRA